MLRRTSPIGQTHERDRRGPATRPTARGGGRRTQIGPLDLGGRSSTEEPPRHSETGAVLFLSLARGGAAAGRATGPLVQAPLGGGEPLHVVFLRRGHRRGTALLDSPQAGSGTPGQCRLDASPDLGLACGLGGEEDADAGPPLLPRWPPCDEGRVDMAVHGRSHRTGSWSRLRPLLRDRRRGPARAALRARTRLSRSSP